MACIFGYRKQQAFLYIGTQVVPLPLLAPPLTGWEVVTDSKVDTVSASIPTVISGNSRDICRQVAYNLLLYLYTYVPGL